MVKDTAKFTELVAMMGRRPCKWLAAEQESDSATRPRRQLTNLSVIVFLGFCAFALVAIAKPNKIVILACGIPYGVVYISFVIWAILDIVRSKFT